VAACTGEKAVLLLRGLAHLSGDKNPEKKIWEAGTRWPGKVDM